MIEITDRVGEKSTVCFFVIVRDADTSLVLTPKSLKYTLVDKDENVINDIQRVSIPIQELGATVITVNGVPTNSTKIALHGDDLMITDEEHADPKVIKAGEVIRYLVLEATYDGLCGDNLPKNDYVKFPIENIPYITEDV